MKNKYVKPIVVAEIGCNHMGKIEIAKDLILQAKEAGSDYAKFQKRNNKELLNDEQYNSPHPNPINSYGDTYGKHREFLEFNLNEHEELKAFCEMNGIGYSTSVWDLTSANEIISLNPDFIKVPSAQNTNIKLLNTLILNFKGDIHISFGMTNTKEINDIYNLFNKNDALGRLVVYSCTSGYPVPPEDVCLLEIIKIKEKFEKKVKSIGFSGHHNGIALDISAYTLGSTWIERHFTLDRTWKGTDHAASLEPSGLKKLIRDLNSTYKALTYKNKDVLDIEKVQRDKLKFI